jgi:hypothetical protein
MRKGLIASAAAIALLAPGAASAASVSIDVITATWSNVAGGSAVNFTGNGTASASVNWGTGGPQSGYVFTAAAMPIVSTLPPSPSPTFTLGTFTHRNLPITSGTSITGVRLTISAAVSIDSVSQGTKNFVFDFDHWETPNSANPCANGGTNGVGVNISGCADRVQVGFNSLSESIVIGADTYTLNIVGFLVGGVPFSEFWTTENDINTALLRANWSLRSEVVPAPMSLALFGMGLAGLGLAMRRRAA